MTFLSLTVQKYTRVPKSSSHAKRRTWYVRTKWNLILYGFVIPVFAANTKYIVIFGVICTNYLPALHLNFREQMHNFQNSLFTEATCYCSDTAFVLGITVSDKENWLTSVAVLFRRWCKFGLQGVCHQVEGTPDPETPGPGLTASPGPGLAGSRTPACPPPGLPVSRLPG